ncbi:hypothetical protein RCL1_006984 [Eukaryota sp. TZLM3-RCL]
MPSVPLLSSTGVDDVLRFLSELRVYYASTAKEETLPLMLMLDPFLYESLLVLDPKLSSEKQFRAFLESIPQFDCYEEFDTPFAKLRMNGSIADASERLADYLRRFLNVRSRSTRLGLPENSFLLRFAKGIVPTGLRDSLMSRVHDGVYENVSQIANTTLEELLDLSRAQIWLKSSGATSDSFGYKRTEGSQFPRKLPRTETCLDDISSNTCFKCHKPGHFARNCPTVPHVHFLSTDVDTPLSLTNPLSCLSKKCERR